LGLLKHRMKNTKIKEQQATLQQQQPSPKRHKSAERRDSVLPIQTPLAATAGSGSNSSIGSHLPPPGPQAQTMTLTTPSNALGSSGASAG
jgi:hypothetical protein